MSAQTLKFEIKLNLPMYMGLSLILHFLILAGFQHFDHQGADDRTALGKKPAPINLTLLGDKNSKSKNSVFIKPVTPSMPKAQARKAGHKLNLSDLQAPVSTALTIPKKTEGSKSSNSTFSKTANSTRPGQLPATRPRALSGLKYGSADFQKMAKDELVGGADILTSKRVALNFEVPNGKNADELNDSQLKLYGFLRRGAIKYVNSISSEIKDFELRNPHLQFPLVDTKQTLTGRLVYDNQGNLKQIKMVRWSNNDKLQGFFENVLKRLENLQNPPKELWAESGEFTVFVTLQING